MGKLTAPKGVFDIRSKPKDPWQAVEIWQKVESMIRTIASDYGFHEIRVPIFERTEVFQRGVGEHTDIVSKEMYTFLDKGKRSLTLRPEGTASVVRSGLEHGWIHEGCQEKCFYLGPMFRYERPQAGRYRQHHQFGAEAFGSDAPEQDVELIDLLCTVYRKLGLKNLHVLVNTIGSPQCRAKFRKALKEFLEPRREELSEDSQRRLDMNPLRILDSKIKQDQELLPGAPTLYDFVDEESRDHFARVKTLLEEIGVSYEVRPKLVRGLDYYNRTVFEVTAEELGAQNSVGGGGRYDGLVHTLGGPQVPACGFAAGLERVIQTLLQQGAPVPQAHKPFVYLIPLGDAAKTLCFELLHSIRSHGIPSEMDFSGKKLKKLLAHANNIGAEHVAIVGDEEIQADAIELKEMATGGGKRIQLSAFTLEMIKLVGDQQQHILDQVTGQLSTLLEKGIAELEEAEQLAEFAQRKHENTDDEES